MQLATSNITNLYISNIYIFKRINSIFSLAKVISVKKQYVSGAVTIFVGQLTDGKTNKQCSITTWEGYPNNIKIKCEGDDAELSFTL